MGTALRHSAHTGFPKTNNSKTKVTLQQFLTEAVLTSASVPGHTPHWTLRPHLSYPVFSQSFLLLSHPTPPLRGPIPLLPPVSRPTPPYSCLTSPTLPLAAGWHQVTSFICRGRKGAGALGPANLALIQHSTSAAYPTYESPAETPTPTHQRELKGDTQTHFLDPN